FNLPEAQRLANAKDQFSQISVIADSGVSQDQVKADIAQALKDHGEGQYEVITGKAITKENQDSLHDQLRFINVFLGVFALVVLAWQASRVSPVAAMRDVQIERATRRGVRLGIGLTLLALGIVALFVGVSGSVDNGIAYVGIGALVVFVAAFVLGPLFARITSLAVGIPIARIKGITGTLARENAARNPKRTSTTATALIIGIALVGFITIFAASAKASVSHAVDEQFKTDYIIRSGSGFGAGGLSPDLAKRLGALPQIQAVTGLRGT